MKNNLLNFFKVIGFIFLVFYSMLLFLKLDNIDSLKYPAIWRLFVETMPLIAVIISNLFFWLIEKKKISFYIFNNALKSILIGTFIGFIWILIPSLFAYILGILKIGNFNNINDIWIWCLAAFLNVIMQEMFIRGYLYQFLKMKYNIFISTIITSLIFTFLHGGAFEVGIVAVLAVFMMSIFMSLLLEYTNSLLAPIMAHFIWNFLGRLFDVVVLASDYPSMFTSTFSGNIILTGGESKIEGSIFTLICNTIFVVFFYWINFRKDKKNQFE